MELFILDTSFRPLYAIDNIRSLIWTERYSAYGDFELMLDPAHRLARHLQTDRYIQMDTSNYTMFIETVETKKSAEESYLKVTGRSLESVLERRVALSDANDPPNANALLFWHVKWAFGLAAFYDSDARKIPNFSMLETVPSGSPTRSAYQYQFKGKTVYEAVKQISDDHRNGFRIDRSGSSLTFRLYRGVDRTIENSNKPVVFSEKYDNLQNWTYLETLMLHKNLAYADIKPNDFLSERYKTHISGTVANPVEPIGIHRREMFVDASQVDELYTDPTNRRYYAQVLGQQELRKVGKRSSTVYDAEIDPNRNPKYKINYNLGDLVSFENDFTSDPLDTVYRVNEYVYSYGQEGTLEYPTFLKIGEYS